jgi:hypothetical protein
VAKDYGLYFTHPIDQRQLNRLYAKRPLSSQDASLYSAPNHTVYKLIQSMTHRLYEERPSIRTIEEALINILEDTQKLITQISSPKPTPVKQFTGFSIPSPAAIRFYVENDELSNSPSWMSQCVDPIVKKYNSFA